MINKKLKHMQLLTGHNRLSQERFVSEIYSYFT